MDKYASPVIFALSLLLCCLFVGLCQGQEKVCRGTNFGLTTQGDQSVRYDNYRSIYRNCTFVEGNLEIVFLERNDFDLSFLSTIKEVTGYVLIVSVFVDTLSLSNLRVIRGRTLYEHDQKYYALYVALNYNPSVITVGLKELQLTSLYEILSGNVFFSDNNLLCFENTIEWRDILTGEGAKVEFMAGNKNADYKRSCGTCDAACSYKGERHCWGSGPNNCQKLTRIVCSEQCEGRCYGKEANQCCHPECAGGCTGPTKNDCWACKNFNNNGTCEAYCPPELVYNIRTYKYERNPNAKYAYGTLCVNKCPEHLMIDKGACVSDCGADRIAGADGKCEECDGLCPKSCDGTPAGDFLNANNIDNFSNCTIVTGGLKILASTLTGDAHRQIPPMSPNRLKILQTVREVNNFVVVQAEHPNLVDLSFLKSLQVIHGRERDDNGNSLQVTGTSIKSLGLKSLRSVQFGKVVFAKNKNLCYVDTIDWKSIVTNPTDQRVIVQSNKNSTQCLSEGWVCHPECSARGCWGQGSDQCLSCKNYLLGGRCVESCDRTVGYYDDGSTECKACHPECKNTCIGKGEDHCDECKHVKDGPNCVERCPEMKYADENGVCQMCHSYCEDGCSGPRNNVERGGCDTCGLVLMANDNTNVTEQCLPLADGCADGYYKKLFSSHHKGPLAGKQACIKCHPECRKCSGPGVAQCEECVNYKQNSMCVTNCSVDYFVEKDGDKAHSLCSPCHAYCLQCHGPTYKECVACKHMKIYEDPDKQDTTQKFECTDKCPADNAPKSHIWTLENGDVETVCISANLHYQLVEAPVLKANMNLIACILIPTIIILLVGVAIGVACCYKKKKREQQDAMVDQICNNVVPSDAQPDMSQLQLVPESEIRKGIMIGSGAFGTVYRGYWVPTDKNVKIPVAIKVLQEDAVGSPTNALLDEARVMASVNNEYCVRIIAVSMTAQVMLLTQLMPLGCLLDYTRANKSSIGSQLMLTWCTQIAKGMVYLEGRGIVHRDLAARNVLVQKPYHVRITDFGLAKLLDRNEREFRSQGGRMPIKWLALECIQHRTFTYKSDVWSYGVTLWEIFTFGERPYEHVKAKDIPYLLEKGERLGQPGICTIDVYMLMIKCWTLDAKSRPSFAELTQEFEKMSQDPGRYLVIAGDKFKRPHAERGELMRNMSNVSDGPEQVMEADEYLNPNRVADDSIASSAAASTSQQLTIPRNGSMSSHSRVYDPRGGRRYDNDRAIALSTSSPRTAVTSVDSDQSQPLLASELSNADADLHHSGRRVQSASSSRRNNSRYSVDPCRLTSESETRRTSNSDHSHRHPSVPEEPDGMLLDASSEDVFNSSGGAGSGVPRIVPLDEDGYLEPQSTSNSGGYLVVMQDDGESTEVVQFATPQTNPEYFAQSPLTAKSAVSYMKQRPIAKPVPLPTVPPTSQSSGDLMKQSPHYDNSAAAYQQPRLHSFRRT